MVNRPDLCLEFVNTRYLARPGRAHRDAERAPEDLAGWTAANGGPRRAAARRDASSSGRSKLRETIHRVFDAEAQDKTPAARDLDALNEALAASPARTTLRRERGAYGWEVDVKSADRAGLLAPVLWSAGDLLAGPRLDRVRRCANPECGWLFLDDSRAGKRRWCSMQSCGNRAKARRHYHRSREQ